MRRIIILVVCVFSLAVVNISIANKEETLANGRIVNLQLAPVDPRSLMQGDYMALRFGISNNIIRLLPRDSVSSINVFRAANALKSTNGRIVAALDERSVVSFSRLDDGQSLSNNEVLLQYRIRGGQLKFATNAFFFQEGHAHYYEKARFGEFRVAPDGELLLTGMRDKDLKRLGPTT